MDKIGQRTTLGVPHLLIHGEAGDPQHVVAPSLEDAMVYAEYLANECGDRSFQVFELREIEMSVKRYYSVRLVDDEAADDPGGPGPMGDAVAIPGIQSISLTHVNSRTGGEMADPAGGEMADPAGGDAGDEVVDGTVEVEIRATGTDPGLGVDHDDSFATAEPELDVAESGVVRISA